MTKLSQVLKESWIGRSFFIYFFICAFLIFTIVSAIQWSAIVWFVSHYERERITDQLTTLRNHIIELELLSVEDLTRVRSIFWTYRDCEYLEYHVTNALPANSMFYVFDLDDGLVYGYYWAEFFEKIYLHDILPPHFIFTDLGLVYNVFHDINFLNVDDGLYKYFLVTAYQGLFIPAMYIQTYTYERLKNSSERHRNLIYRRLMREDPKGEFTVVTADDILSYGVFARFDLDRNYAVFHIVQYPREIFVFLMRYLYLNAFIIVSLFLILSTISFSFISNKIFNPIWNLIDKMKFTSENPQAMLPIVAESRGEILQIYEYYNKMALSVSDYHSELSKSKNLFEKINIGIFSLDTDYNIKHCNKAFKGIFDITSFKGLTMKDLILYDIKERDWVGNKLEINPYYCVNISKHLSIVVHANKVDDVTEYFGLVYDITEKVAQAKVQRSLELELIRINRLSEVGKRVQGIVHNLNSPLNSVIGFAQLLADDYPENKDIKKIINTARTMSGTIKTLLQKTIDDSIAMPKQVNLNTLLNQELSFCSQDLFFKHNTALELSLAEQMPDISLVYGDIAQVFQTLFNNAVEAMLKSENRVLTITSFVEGYFIGFTVRDTGMGMADEALSRIFEPGFSTKVMTDESGFGLGLALAKIIIDKLGGKIMVKTELGVGSEFVVYLPSY